LNGARVPKISDDGRYVPFSSDHANAAAGDANTTMDIFVVDTGQARGDDAAVFVASPAEGPRARRW
jgi:hypothetical protein